MEAPVPASALIHSATLVSAGIYLLLRFTTLFELSKISIFLIAIIGSLTAFYGGLVSMYQSDTKRILSGVDGTSGLSGSLLQCFTLVDLSL